MTDEKEETKVVSLDAFRARKTDLAPKPAVNKSAAEDKARKKLNSNSKLQAALDKYGSTSGNVMKQQFKKKVDLEEKQDGDV